MLQNQVAVFQQIGAAKAPPGSAGLDLLLVGRPAESQRSDAWDKGGPLYSQKEVDFAWECTQKEAQALLSELIQPGDSPASLAGLSPGGSTPFCKKPLSRLGCSI